MPRRTPGARGRPPIITARPVRRPLSRAAANWDCPSPAARVERTVAVHGTEKKNKNNNRYYKKFKNENLYGDGGDARTKSTGVETVRKMKRTENVYVQWTFKADLLEFGSGVRLGEIS